MSQSYIERYPLIYNYATPYSVDIDETATNLEMKAMYTKK